MVDDCTTVLSLTLTCQQGEGWWAGVRGEVGIQGMSGLMPWDAGRGGARGRGRHGGRSGH